MLAALERADHAGAKALVEDLLAIAGIASVGGRSAGEIADRFLEQAASGADPSVNSRQQSILRRFLAISGDPDAAHLQLRALAGEAGLDLAAALDSFDQRIGFLAARGLLCPNSAIPPPSCAISIITPASSSRPPTPPIPPRRPAIGGGRYDGLARKIGAASDLPAVGAAIWVDRLPRAGARS